MYRLATKSIVKNEVGNALNVFMESARHARIGCKSQKGTGRVALQPVTHSSCRDLRPLCTECSGVSWWSVENTGNITTVVKGDSDTIVRLTMKLE